MFLPQWLLNALRRVLRGHAGGLSPLKGTLFLWRFFRRLFQRVSRTQDDGAPDKPPQHIADQVSYLPLGVEPMKCTMSLVVNGDTDEPVPAAVCRSAVIPGGPQSSHGMAPMSVASRSQTGLALEADLNASNGHPPPHGSRLSSITSSLIEASLYSSAHSNFSRSSQSISSTAYNSAADAHLSSSDVHPPHTSTPGQGRLSSGSGAAAAPHPPTAAQRDGQNQNGVPNFTLRDDYAYIRAVVPSDTGFFVQDRPRKAYNPDSLLIAPLTNSFFLHDIPRSWSVHAHPRGPRYYVRESYTSANTSSMPSMPYVSLPLRVITDANIVDPAEWRLLSRFLDNIISYMYAGGISVPPKVDLFLGQRWSDREGTMVCVYYFADHIHRSIFWLDAFDIRIFSRGDSILTTEPSHLAHAIEAQYWHHYDCFPGCQEMTGDTIEEAKDFIIDCLAEASETSYIRYGLTLPQLQQYLSIMTSIINSRGSYYHPGSLCAVARIMMYRSNGRYVDFYGEPGAKLGRFGQHNRERYKRLRTPLILLLSPLLFFASDTHYIALLELFVDGVTTAEWSAFIRKLSNEWQDFVINATVLLNANIAFLAIQSIDDSSVDKGRSPAQIASYVSTIVSIGSITVGLLLLQKYRHKNRVYYIPQWDFLGIQRGELGEKLGLETLAIMYSLPWALLMWAMIFFLAAFCIMCFTASSLLVRMIVGSILLAIGILIFWYLTISRERYELRWYVRAHAHLVNAWDQLPPGLSARLPAKFNMGWMKRMPRTGSNNVEMAAMDSSTTASLDSDESTTCSQTSVSSYESLASSSATMSLYDTASMRSHGTGVDVV